jgi:hypothetical protein
MLTVEILLPDGERDAVAIVAGLVQIDRHRTAIRAALSALADLHSQMRDHDADDGARLMSEATETLLADRATIDQTAAELTAIGGAAERADLLRRAREIKAPEGELVVLAGRYLACALRAARLARIEAAAASLDAALTLTIKGADDAG